jgi:ribosomal protein S18 acetylase RimI-like enzyme
MARPEAARVRALSRDDLEAVVRLDALHTGAAKRRYWTGVFEGYVDRSGERHGTRIGLAAEVEDRLAGYVFGEVRAFEFGSPPCGWIFAVGVDPKLARRGVASALLHEACARFRASKVTQVRTMVRRTDVPVLSFFRARGFVGGPFVQLERDLVEESA